MHLSYLWSDKRSPAPGNIHNEGADRPAAALLWDMAQSHLSFAPTALHKY